MYSLIYEVEDSNKTTRLWDLTIKLRWNYTAEVYYNTSSLPRPKDFFSYHCLFMPILGTKFYNLYTSVEKSNSFAQYFTTFQFITEIGLK